MKFNAPSLTMFALFLVSSSLYCTDAESERKKDASLAAAIAMPKEVTPEMAELIDQDAAAKLKAMLRKQEITDARLLGKALVWAAAQDKTKVATLLLEQGADVNVTVEGEHALIAATRQFNFPLAGDILQTIQVDLGHIVDTHSYISELPEDQHMKHKKIIAQIKSDLIKYPYYRIEVQSMDLLIADPSVPPIIEKIRMACPDGITLSIQQLTKDWSKTISQMSRLAVGRRLPIIRKQAATAQKDSYIHLLDMLFHAAYLNPVGFAEASKDDESTTKAPTQKEKTSFEEEIERKIRSARSALS